MSSAVHEHHSRRPLRPAPPGEKYAGSPLPGWQIVRSSNSFGSRKAEQKLPVKSYRISATTNLTVVLRGKLTLAAKTKITAAKTIQEVRC